MPISHCYLFKNSLEFRPKSEVGSVPEKTRGIYVLYQQNDNGMSVVYIGMARGEKSGIAGRLKQHIKSKEGWTHFSAFEVWDNISRQQVEELEGLFRHIYCKDATANRLNKQRRYKPLSLIQRNSGQQWE